MSYHRRYKLKDDRFGLLALTLREKAGLTQAEVAGELGVSERTIRHWEAGTAYPASDNLKELIELYLRNSAFVSGHERDDAKVLWGQAVEGASRRKPLFDDAWFDDLLKRQQNARTQREYERQEPGLLRTPSPPEHTDWGEAIDVPYFYGREQEMQTLKQWVDGDRCRVVILLGMGGIGKTTLSIRFAQEVTVCFDFIFWRSLRNAPPLQEWLTDCILTLSEQQSTPSPHNVEKNLALLIELLRKRRCLLVFDNAETLLQPGSLEGGYREGYEGYGMLIQRIAETMHQSCLLLTSREMLSELESLEGKQAAVRVLKLAGLGQAASQELLADKDISGSPQDWQQLIQHYSGNPLVLKMVAATVRDLFGGDIAEFVRAGLGTLHTLRQLLEHQFARLVPLERDIMYWLAIERAPVSLETLRAALPERLSGKDVLSALHALRRRCLIERGERGATFTLQPEVMEYVSERLVEQMCEEIIQASPGLVLTHALTKAQSNDYLRESQVRMLLQPLLSQLLLHFGSEQEVEQQLQRLVPLLREKPAMAQGYGGGNLVNLLAYLKGHLKQQDFSSLAIRQAYLQGIEARDANFAGAHFSETVFMEPIESIASMAMSPDGLYLAVGSFSGQIRVWRVTDRKVLLTWQGHSRMVWALTFSPDSSMLASGGYDGQVRLWNIQGEDGAGGRCLRTLSGHERWVRSLAFSPDGAFLASASDDETIRLWDIQRGTCERVLRGHSGFVWSLAFSPDSALLISGGLDETVRVWEMRDGMCLDVLRGHKGIVMALAFRPSGDVLASGDENGHLKLWDRTSRRCLASFQLRTTRATSIAFNKEGTLLAVGSQEGATEIWHVADNNPTRLRMLPGHPIWVSTVAFGPNNFLASTSYGGKVKLWDAESGQCLGTLQGYSQVICSMSFSPDGRLLVHGDDQGIIHVWDVSSGSRLNTFRGLAGRVWSVAFSPDGKTIACGGDDQTIRLWKLGSGREEEREQSLSIFRGHTTMIWSVVFSPDGSILASSGFERVVRLWKISRGQEQTAFTLLAGHTSFVWSLAFSPDSRRLASGGDDGEIKIWDVVNGQCLMTLQIGRSPIGVLAFSPDGNTLLSNSNDGTVMVWDIRPERGGRELLQSQGHVGWTKAVAFSQDGTMLAVGSDDYTVRVWRLEQPGVPTSLRTFSRHGGQVWAVTFSPDNRLLASGDDDGTLVLWDVETGACLQVLRSERPYERMNIQGVKGLTLAQRSSLKTLGAIISSKSIGL